MKWNEWRQSLKAEEKSHLGSNGISESVEMAGWGVEQAQERNKEEASEFERNLSSPFGSLPNMALSFHRNVLDSSTS